MVNYCMGKLIYSAIASADGYIEDAKGGFEWAAPDEDVFRFVNELERPVGTYLYGRRMYETMLYWETAYTIGGQVSWLREFTGIWQAARKIVFSRTLQSVSSAGTRIERDFTPGIVRQLKETTGHDMTVGGANLAGQAIRAGLVASCSCSWCRPWSEAANPRSPAMSAWTWSFRRRAGSRAAPSFSGISPSQPDRRGLIRIAGPRR